MTQTFWETEDVRPALGLFVRDTTGRPRILAACITSIGWFCMECPIEHKTKEEIDAHVTEHLEPRQV